jgi:hypothetical protein
MGNGSPDRVDEDVLGTGDPTSTALHCGYVEGNPPAADGHDFENTPLSLVIYCADIGSVSRGNFGWARLVAERGEVCSTSREIERFVEQVSDDLNAGAHVALGFECPLFLPLSEDPAKLTSARPGEGDRAWSAGAGAGSLATGLTQTVWILDQIKRRAKGSPGVFVDWPGFRAEAGGLYLWEAFVTKAAKSDTHHGDAELAVLSFQESLPEPETCNAVVCQGLVRSLFGAALLQTRWVEDLQWLSKSCLVIRAQVRDQNPVERDATPPKNRLPPLPRLTGTRSRR